MSRKRIVVVCPGRGSYTKESLGYLNGRKEIHNDLLLIDKLRQSINEPTISELDQAKAFKVSLHTKGEHASPLIYTCSLADFLSIDQKQYEIVAMTGNSMGWYLALAFSGALSREDSFQLIQTMGSMMKNQLIGGQIIYPWINDDWQIDHERKSLVTESIKELQSQNHKIYLSIRLGGYAVIAGETEALNLISKKLPPLEHYPFQLVNHGAFHTPLLRNVSQNAFQRLSEEMFQAPEIPLVDGRGCIWQPHSTKVDELYNYTLGHQVIETYDFTKSISVSLKEFAPDHLVLLGPGNSLGGAIGQVMIENSWHNIEKKSDFVELQKDHPFLISMGLTQQKQLLQTTMSF